MAADEMAKAHVIDHKKYITKRLSKLVDSIDLKGTTIWEQVIDKGLISADDAAYIKEENKNNRDQVRALLLHLTKQTLEDFRVFQEILKEKHKEKRSCSTKKTKCTKRKSKEGIDEAPSEASSSKRRIVQTSAQSAESQAVALQNTEGTTLAAQNMHITINQGKDTESDSKNNEREKDYKTSRIPVRRGKYRKHGFCYNCGRKGHWSPDCPY